MYLAHWNLREYPFQNVADPRFAYLSEQHQEALARLVYVVQTGKLGAVLTGTYGVGKSMILELLVHHAAVRDSVRVIRFDVPPDGTLELAASLLSACGITRPFSTPSAALTILRETVEKENPPFPPLVLILDEAHALRTDLSSFEFLQRLLNLTRPVRTDADTRPPVTLILSGLPELESELAGHPPLRQRLGYGWRLEPLDARQVREYVAFRMRAAGGDIFAFEDEALETLAEASTGLPRVINNLCDAALMIGYAARVSRITVPILQQAIEEVQGGKKDETGETRHV